MASQIIFIIIAAAAGFGVGWIMRGQQTGGGTAGSGIRATPGGAAGEERDRLRAELEAARSQHARLEGSVAEAQSLAETRAARVRELEEQVRLLESQASDTVEREPQPDMETTEDEGTPPVGMAAPEGERDDLKLISGIGPAIEKTLHELGIHRFQQIAAFTPENVAWVNRRLRFKGRIEREDWIGQAKKLAASEVE